MLSLNKIAGPTSHVIADIGSAQWSNYCVVVTSPAGWTKTVYEEQTECQFIYETETDNMMHTYSLLFETESTPYVSICRDNEYLLSLAVEEPTMVDGLLFELHSYKE